MRNSFVIGVTSFALVAGCGTLLDIQPEAPPDADGGGLPVDAAMSDGDAGTSATRDAADAAPNMSPCALAMATDPCVLASGLVSLGSIAVGGNNVYFTRHEAQGAIYRAPAEGGAVTPFSSSLPSPAGLFAAPSTLYFVTEGNFEIVRQDYAAPMTTGATTYGISLPAAQVVNVGSDTFWTLPGTGANAGQVRATMTFNSGAALVTGATQPTAIAADATYVYYATKTTTGHVVRFLHDGTSMMTETLAFNDINAIALSAVGIVAITSGDGVYRASTTDTALFQGGWQLVSSSAAGVGLVADDKTGTLYVLNADGGLEVITNTPPPSPPVVIPKLSLPSCTVGRAIAQDDKHVYVACEDTIVRVPK